jgi:hypothetical protein
MTVASPALNGGKTNRRKLVGNMAASLLALNGGKPNLRTLVGNMAVASPARREQMLHLFEDMIVASPAQREGKPHLQRRTGGITATLPALNENKTKL